MRSTAVAPAGGPASVKIVSQPEAPIRGEAVLRAIEGLFLRAEATSRRLFPDAQNPLLHTGAVANTLLLIAVATGGVVLFWYSPSVHFAHSSMVDIEAAFFPRLVRSLHRYSSDACMAVVVWHAARLTAARRFTGARWLAWLTGLAAIALLWVVGWTGYWLVWDERARQVATGTARFLDQLPVFVDPLAGAFLTDAGVNSLLFFIVFFVHMLIPLVMAVALWLHIARLQRPDFLAGKTLSLGLGAVLLALSVVAPAWAARPARMSVFPSGFDIDAWFLLPLWLTDRLTGGTVWLLALGAGALLYAVPWLLAKGKLKPATILSERCNGCEHCVADCPYEAISLVPRTDGRPFKTVALVDPARCIGCGVCAGSCSSAGSTLPHFDTLVVRAREEAWLDQAGTGPKPFIAYLCHDAASSALEVDAETGLCPQLPGYRVQWVPCAGWVHSITVERLLRRGSPGVLIVGCSGTCRYREGVAWTQLRVEGKRWVELADRVDRGRVRVVELNRLQTGTLLEEAARFRSAAASTPPSVPARWRAIPAAAAMAAGVWAMSVAPYTAPRPTGARLAVSFKHPGVIAEKCRIVSPEELAKKPIHMRREKECERARQPVRLKLAIDGRELLVRQYRPGGLWKDGASVALEEFDVAPGPHQVEISIGDSGDEAVWDFHQTHPLDFVAGERHTVTFDRTAGFGWH